MPFYEGSAGRVYYRHWAHNEPVGQIVFLHGYGEHSGLYHRFGDHMLSNGLDVWAPDAIGHGLSEGQRGWPSSIEHLQTNAELLTAIARSQRPGLPTALVGHSMGAIVALALVSNNAAPFTGAVLTGLPIEVLTAEQLDSLPQAVMSSDPFYLDEFENDPLGVDLSLAPARITALLNPDILGKMQAVLPKVDLPLLLISGDLDVFCAPEVLRKWAASNPRARSRIFPGGYHDIINNAMHAEVGLEIADAAKVWSSVNSPRS